jgi:hypothetical protein
VVDQHPTWTTDAGRTFRDDFETRYGVSPTPDAGGLAYDATKFFISVTQQAYQEHGELSRQALYT